MAHKYLHGGEGAGVGAVGAGYPKTGEKPHTPTSGEEVEDETQDIEISFAADRAKRGIPLLVSEEIDLASARPPDFKGADHSIHTLPGTSTGDRGTREDPEIYISTLHK